MILTLSVLPACRTTHTIPQTQIITEYRYVDSIVLHDSVVYRELPRENDNDVVNMMDTLFMETSLASAKAYVDTATNTLKGNLENKHIDIPIEIQY